MKIIKLTAIIFLFGLFLFEHDAQADKCIDYLLLEGADPLVDYGMDTTRHWWAVTQPFTDQYRMIIDGREGDVYREIKELKFSPDGNRWAYFGMDNLQWYLVTSEKTYPLPGTGAGEIEFSPNSESLVYTYFDADIEYIIFNNRKIRVYQRTGSIYLSWAGEKYAILGYRGDNLVININGSESTLFDEIKPMGFWWDGKFVFAARSGDRWRIYKGDEEISDIYRSISEVAINLYGTAAGASAALSSGKMVAILFSDEYREPLISKQYNSVSNIALHPEVPLLSFGADWEGTNYVVLSSTEYFAGPEYSKPAFSYDGSELYFIGCDIDCFVSINGRRCPTKTMLEINYNYAYKPGSRTMAYSTSSTMIVRYLDTQELYAGMMVDRIIPPRYNWRMRRYETLGNVSGKLYLLTCRV